MRVDRFASCEKIVPRFQTRPPLTSFSLKETLLQPVLKSFITIFIQYNERLENKLTRALLLGLAKSMCYRLILSFIGMQRVMDT